ncbi:MAG TPA: YbjQ family protein [Gemmatimonadaceae bacterium]|nr:YbjQ family protein [Gemmatimonadaceae bacterium]
MPIDPGLITTANQLEGWRVSRSLGVVRGITVRSRSFLGLVGAAVQTLRGGDISLFTELCERARADAFGIMVRHAEELGANALIAVRYDATEIMTGVSEVLCYGTAVVVERG